MPSWHLADADLLAAEKYTFYEPNRELLARAAPGEVVKLIFRFESDDPEAPSAERMRVLVDEAIDGVNFKGRLDNEPRYITDLKADDPLNSRLAMSSAPNATTVTTSSNDSSRGVS